MSGWDHGGRSSAERGYGWSWQKLRQRILKRDDGLCRPCLSAEPSQVTVARQVDHIIPKAKGGTDDPANLQAICDDCHAAKSAEDRGATLKPKRAVGFDGWPE